MRTALRLLVGLFCLGVAEASVEIIPTPQYLEPLPHKLVFRRQEAVRLVAGAESSGSGKTALAISLVREALQQMKVSSILASAGTDSGPAIHFWDYSGNPNLPVALNFLDREMLSDPAHQGQGYVVRSPDARTVWVVGSSAQGVLYGAASLLQLLRPNAGGAEAPGVYIRDFPDFEFRAASDWLLNVEGNRWALDRGQGMEAFTRLVKQRLDRALRFKINMALIDGFGWGLEQRFPEYPALMRELNRYARARGIRLLYGGYGAAYDWAQNADDYQGTVFLNRESYPDGPTYRCLAFPQPGKRLDPHTMGSCRANDELNRLKGDDLARFVEAVEPGALYIHHEDCCVFEDFEKAWLGRCERCRRRWPNDKLLAADGGAGAIAHGYSVLIEAVNRVKRPESGFDASKDTEIILISPVYMPATSKSDDWAQVLELWRIIARLLPRAGNVQIGFREILPQEHGGRTWIEAFSAVMKREELPFGAFVFSAGGADNYLTDYPWSGAPAMNAHFLGARTIYNATGDFYREPMEILAAEYSWNTRSTGFFRNPASAREFDGIEKWVYEIGQPEEIFATGRIYDRICNLLYGAAAGPAMSAYYRESIWLPESPPRPAGSERPYYQGRRALYLPRTWNRIHAVPSHWYHLLIDAKTWSAEIEDQGYRRQLADLGIDRRELHRRLARRWRLSAELNAAGEVQVRKALQAGPLPETVADLEFLGTLFRVYQPLLESLALFHEARSGGGSPERQLDAAYRKAQQAQGLADRAFPQPVDPAMGEVRSLRHYPARLMEAVQGWKGR